MEVKKMTMEVTDKEFAATKFPLPGWILIKKDKLPAKLGNIHVDEGTRDRDARWQPTGIVMKKSPAFWAENQYHEQLYALLKPGDRVGYNPANPIPAPVPHFFELKKDEFENRPDFIYIHVEDVLEHIVLKNEDTEKLILRYKEVTEEYFPSQKEDQNG